MFENCPNNMEEKSLAEAEKLLNLSGKEILALSLRTMDDGSKNHQIVMDIKMREASLSLIKNIKDLKNSISFNSWVMGIMTFLILVLTGVLVWKGP